MAILGVKLIADASAYKRALRESEVATKRWARNVQQIGGAAGLGGGLFGGLGKGGAALAGAGAAALALKTVVSAASNAQQILGQTSVAVQDAGLSWAKYGQQVEAAADRISKSSAFDDEAVLQSFQVFVRGQKDVATSIDLAALAADVARGRYTDLETATSLVNKAAMGQVGALRRAGIAIDKNATSVEALTALDAAYSGAAVEHANSAGGAYEALLVSVENLEESLGKGLLPIVSALAIQVNEGVTAMGHLGAAMQAVDDSSHGFLSVALENLGKVWKYTNPAGGIIAGITLINKAFGGGGGGGGEPAPGMAGPAGKAAAAATDWSKIAGQTKKAAASTKEAAKAAGDGRKSVTELVQQRNDWFDAMIDRRQFRLEDAPLRGQFQQLQEIQALIVARINVTADITRRMNLEDQLLSVQRQMQGVREQFAAEAVEHERKMADLAAQRKQAAADRFESTMDWLEFAFEKAEATKGIKDDIARQKDIIAALKQRIQAVGATLDLQRRLFRAEQALKEKRNQGRTAATVAPRMAGSIFRQAAPTVTMLGPTLRGDAGVPLSLSPRPSVQINGGLHLHGVQNVPQLEDELVKRSKQRPIPRRGR